MVAEAAQALCFVGHASNRADVPPPQFVRVRLSVRLKNLKATIAERRPREPRIGRSYY